MTSAEILAHVGSHSGLPWLPSHIHLLTKSGSHAYGLATPESDLDIKGVAIPPRSYFTGFVDRFDQAEFTEPDMTIYDIRKFFALAANCNPNIIEMLWTDDADLLLLSEIGAIIRQNRQSFLSRKAKFTFSGYAMAQMKRMRTHRGWLLQPPDHPPTRREFGLPEQRLMSADERGAMEAVLTKNPDPSQFSPHAMAIYEKERAYGNAMREWKQYQNWVATRNPARAALEAQVGYNAKHAMHLVRLMKMCREILTTGDVVVKRPDREELLAVRNGTWGYDQLIEWAEQQDAAMQALYETSSLPHSPNRKHLNTLCAELVERAVFQFNRGGYEAKAWIEGKIEDNCIPTRGIE